MAESDIPLVNSNVNETHQASDSTGASSESNFHPYSCHYEKERYENLADFEKETGYLYPHTYPVTCSIPEFRRKYDTVCETGVVYNDPNANGGVMRERISARVISKRCMGTGKIYFYTVISEGVKVQITARCDLSDADGFEHHTRVKIGDIVGADGWAGRTKKGELSLFCVDLVLLSPCVIEIPKENSHIEDPFLRVKHRELDMISNPNHMRTFLTRTKIFKFIRDHMHSLNFVEVETPILAIGAGGATARPFHTKHNDSKKDLTMRIAPELYLKRLVVGGIPRVFELGKVFRNEGLDATHQSEFTTLEYYMANADYVKLMAMTEIMLFDLVTMLKKENPVVEYQGQCIDFSPPYQQIDIMTRLGEVFIELNCGECPDDLSSDEARDFLENACKIGGVSIEPPLTTARLLDKLIGHYIEPKCINPTFIINHPAIMSPLAKQHRHNPQVTERFELFVNGTELCNAYTELNDPRIQKLRFEEQSKAKKAGDDEIPETDEDFLYALRVGLPPTGGFGMGMDRLTMLLTDNQYIRDVIFFPL